MKHLIYEKVIEHFKVNQKSWMAIVVYAEGSTPARMGMKMLIPHEGELMGTIGGGAVEKCVVDRIRELQPTSYLKWSFDLDGNTLGEKTDMICGGAIEILVEPLFNMHQLYIIGGGHCGQVLAELAARTDFSVTVIDDRPECANRQKHPYAAQVICSDYQEVVQHICFSPDTYIVIMTNGHKHDGSVLQQVIQHPHKYIGVIGSQKKTKAMFERLLDLGVNKSSLSQIFSPIGFNIGSQTPMEVAISVLSQLIAVKKGKNKIVFNSNFLYKEFYKKGEEKWQLIVEKI